MLPAEKHLGKTEWEFRKLLYSTLKLLSLYVDYPESLPRAIYGSVGENKSSITPIKGKVPIGP